MHVWACVWGHRLLDLIRVVEQVTDLERKDKHCFFSPQLDRLHSAIRAAGACCCCLIGLHPFICLALSLTDGVRTACHCFHMKAAATDSDLKLASSLYKRHVKTLQTPPTAQLALILKGLDSA